MEGENYKKLCLLNIWLSLEDAQSLPLGTPRVAHRIKGENQTYSQMPSSDCTGSLQAEFYL
jgi:hypothetical protein